MILVVLLGVTGGLLFLFSEQGNAMLKPYLQERLSQELGMPVQIRSFRLQSGQVSANMVIDGKAQAGVIARYNLWKRTFRGSYRVVAKDFVYEGAMLRQADIKGRFAGTPDKVDLKGKGTLLDAPVTLHMQMRQGSLVALEANATRLPMRELLALAKQPPIAKGEMDVKIDMPHIGEEGAKGEGHIIVHKGYLSAQAIRRSYGYPLPKDMPFTLRADAILKGEQIDFEALGKSALFMLKLDHGSFDTRQKRLYAKYDLNIEEMRILSQNKLAGALHLQGDIAKQEEKLVVKGKSGSLGGDLRFDIGEDAVISLRGVSAEKILMMLRQPHYLSGKLTAEVKIADIKQMGQGSYSLSLRKGRLDSGVIRKHFGYALPPGTTLEGESKGEIREGVMYADTKIRSSVAELTLSKLRYTIAAKELESLFNLHFYKIAKDVTLQGKVSYKKKISLKGEAKGLGKSVRFSYDGTRARLESQGMRIEKIISLASLPTYLQGALDAKIVLDDTTRMNGSYNIHAKRLVTLPAAMKRLIGRPAKVTLWVDAKGRLKAYKAYGDAVIKSTVGTLRLEKMTADLKQGTLQSQYRMDIPDLTTLYALTGTKLYGTLQTTGKVRQGRTLRIDGSTASLGGRVDYMLVGEHFSTTIRSVPLERILKMLGYTPVVEGKASGKARYNLKRRKGKADLTLASFRIKPNEWTRVLTPVLGKDPSRIIFKKTTFHADINGDIVTYTLHAKGTRSAIDVTEGRIDQRSGTQRAKFKVVYGKYTVYGKIKGTLDHPKITIDTSRLLKDKFQNKLQKKIEKKWGKEAGALLRGLGL